MKLGISTACLYPMLAEEAAVFLAERQVPYLEFFANAYSEIGPAYLEKLRRQLDVLGTRVVSLHPFTSGLEPMLFFSRYERRLQEGFGLYRRFFEAAAILGAEVLVFHGDNPGDWPSEEEAFDRFGKLALIGREYGVTLAQENVVRCRSKDIGFLTRMKAHLGELAAFTLDVKQAKRAGHSFWDYLEPLGESVRHIHLSDADAGSDCLPVGKGTEDLAALFAWLKKTDYKGGVVMELYRESYGSTDELAAGLSVMRQLAE